MNEFVSRQCSTRATNLSLSHKRLQNDQTRQFVMMHVNKWEKWFKLLTV